MFIRPIPPTVEQHSAPVYVGFPAPRTPLDAKLRRTALRVFYRLWFAEIAEFDEDCAFSVHTAQLAMKMEIKRCMKRAAAELAESKRDENGPYRHMNLLWDEQYRLKADAWRNLLDCDLEMFKLCFREVRRVRADIEAEHARIYSGAVA